MSLKELFITGWWSERHREHIRPVWQMVALFPLYLIYLPARSFVSWMDKQ